MPPKTTPPIRPFPTGSASLIASVAGFWYHSVKGDEAGLWAETGVKSDVSATKIRQDILIKAGKGSIALLADSTRIIRGKCITPLIKKI
jgi:hypothetical protein